MKALFRPITAALGRLSRAPEAIGDQVQELKQTPGGRRLVALDESAGRLYARAHAAFWFAVCVPAALLGYGAWLLADGPTETVLIAIAAGLFLAAARYAIAHLRRPQAASEVLIEELEDRVRPARWALRVLRFFGGRNSATAE
jgi:hypothetical protein